MADLVLESVRRISLQSLDKALSLTTELNDIPYDAAKEIAGQALLRTKHLEQEINRFFTDTQRIGKP